MYKVFFNDREIVITGKRNAPILKEHIKIENLNSDDDVKNWFLDFAARQTHSAILIHPQPEEFWNELFLPAFTQIPAAGGVVIRNEKMLSIFRNEKWDLPKGKIDFGETAKEAAIREVAEECGIDGHQITKGLPSTFHIYQSPYKKTLGQWILKETFWFEMEYSGSENGTPETKENITEIRWFAKNELDEVLANMYENLKSVILRYIK
ncbi:MAG TPA: NUDIX domain-containing protein [Draconibacterium sp.]|nr:NUDIX domain-containing protein [Draconibacterium sp.]